MNEFIIYGLFPEEDDFGTDPWEYDVELNGEIIAGYGDDYHDKGGYKSKGFIKGYAKAMGWEKGVDYTSEYKEKVKEGLR